MLPEIQGLLTRGTYKQNILTAGQQKLRKMQMDMVMCFVIYMKGDRCTIFFIDKKKMPVILAREILQQEYRSWFDVH